MAITQNKHKQTTPPAVIKIFTIVGASAFSYGGANLSFWLATNHPLISGAILTLVITLLVVGYVLSKMDNW